MLQCGKVNTSEFGVSKECQGHLKLKRGQHEVHTEAEETDEDAGFRLQVGVRLLWFLLSILCGVVETRREVIMGCTRLECSPGNNVCIWTSVGRWSVPSRQ